MNRLTDWLLSLHGLPAHGIVMPVRPHRPPPRRAIWAAVTLLALAVLLVRVVPVSIEHRDEIHAAGAAITLCAAHAQQRGDGEARTLGNLGRCAELNNDVRREKGDALAALLLLAVTASGTWHIAKLSGREPSEPA
ncbi:MAG: hypothetical protein HOV67_14305 [Kribbellaceae bacterium]|nr:hypothetical protein [Kribbellaceae bacterium]